MAMWFMKHLALLKTLLNLASKNMHSEQFQIFS